MNVSSEADIEDKWMELYDNTVNSPQAVINYQATDYFVKHDGIYVKLMRLRRDKKIQFDDKLFANVLRT